MSNKDFDENRVEAIRKVEFDKGIPLSMDYPDNSVHSVDLSVIKLTTKISRKIFTRPNFILLIVLYIFFIVAVSLNLNEVMSMEILLPMLPPAALLVIEIIFESLGILIMKKIDAETNSQTAQVYDVNQKTFCTVQWKDIKVGHIIKICRDEIVPADIIILEAMDHNHICYVDESSLTGVFDRYIIKKSCIDTRSPVMKQVSVNDYMKNIKGMIKYEQPNMDMKKFDARLKLESYPRASDINIENFMLRGSSLKNTKGIYGLVVYTGMDTKIMQVLKSNTSKNSQTEGKQERNFLFTSLKAVQFLLIIFYFVMTLIYVMNLVYKYRKIQEGLIRLPFFDIKSTSRVDIYYSIFQFALTFQLIIPYSWFNLIYISYYIMSKFIEYDVKVRINAKNKTEIINTDVAADFGQVKYILADKTGTLTNRKFHLKGISHEGKFYSLEPSTEKEESLFKFESFDLNDLELYQELKSRNFESTNLKNFVEEMMINHSVTTWICGNKQDDILNNERKLGSAFAEEKALLKYLEFYGYTIIKATFTKVEIEVQNERKNFEIIARNKYTNNRKCSSLIYKKHPNDDDSILLCKCYDIDMLPRLLLDKDEPMAVTIKYQVEKLSQMGYRYVFLLKKNLPYEETEQFIDSYKSAENNLLQQENQYENLSIGIETNLSLVGAIFFEEVFSDDLKFSLNKLKLADIHTWIVSGDRFNNVEAVARNLGLVSNLTNDIVVFTEKDYRDDIDNKISMQLMLILDKKTLMTNTEKKEKEAKRSTTIFIHGRAFSIICKESRLYQTFALLLIYTENLFGSGFTPLDKYNLTKMMKKFVCHNCKVLAIGDGLNDVMMLKEADLSIGIRSREILQVKNTCDLIVSKFSQIADLILVHGSWNLKRTSKICFYSLYSSILIIMPFFHKQFFSEVYENSMPDYFFLLFSLLILNFCIVTVFCFDQHVERCVILISPHIFSDNFEQNNNKRLFIETVFRGLIDSLIIYYGHYLVLDNPLNSEGKTFSNNQEWVLLMITSYILVYLKLAFIHLNMINIVIFLVLFLSFGGIVTVGYSYIDTFHSLVDTLSFLVVQVNIFGIVIFSFLYELVIQSYCWYFHSSILMRLKRKFHDLTKGKNIYVYLYRL